jgi:phosphoglycolate phosphatase
MQASPTRRRARNKTQFELLVFDLDGTLVDTSRDLAHAVNFALAQSGRAPLPLAKVMTMVGDGARTLLTRALEGPTEETLQSALQKFREHYAAHLTDHSRPYPGIAQVLAHFRQKKKAVLTNKPHEFTTALLERLRLSQAFVAIQGAQSGLPLKPDPMGLQNLLARLAIEPARALMIGDGENDVLAGKAAGVRTCAATYGFRPAEKLLALAPDFVIARPRDLLALV